MTEQDLAKLYEMKWQHSNIQAGLDAMQRYLDETESAIADHLTDGVYRVPGLIELGIVATVEGGSVTFTQIDPLFEVENESGEITLENLDQRVRRMIHDRLRTGTDLDKGFPDFSFEFGDAVIPSVEEVLDQTQGGSDEVDSI